MVDMQGICDIDICTTWKVRSRHNLIEESYIELTTLAGIPELKASFDIYGPAWMGEP